MRKRYIKYIGLKGASQARKDVRTVKATTWGGKGDVVVVYPKRARKRTLKEVGDFLLGELDNHDAYDVFKKSIK